MNAVRADRMGPVAARAGAAKHSAAQAEEGMDDASHARSYWSARYHCSWSLLSERRIALG
jgi:hypothetical protein